MRVLLVEPPKTPWEMMGDVAALPLGLAQLAACLEQADIPVEILDANALGIGWEGLETAIAQASPDLVGITVYTPHVPEVSRAVRVARQAAPQAVIALGGPHVTFKAEETLQTMPQVDVLARGEGDQILVDLARALDAGDGLERVPGISFRQDGSAEPSGQASGRGLAEVGQIVCCRWTATAGRNWAALLPPSWPAGAVPSSAPSVPSGPFGAAAGVPATQRWSSSNLTSW